MFRLCRVCTILCCLLLCHGTAWAEKLDRIVAVVNGDIILYSEIQDSIKKLVQNSPEVKLDDPQTKMQLEKQMLQQLIRERLTDQEVKRLKIVVTKSDVDETIERIKSENHFSDEQLDETIQKMGKTREQFREEMKKEMERSRLLERALKSKIVITNEQVDAVLKSKGGDVSETKERRRLSMIFLPVPQGSGSRETEEAERLGKELHGRLKQGADFAKLAREHSKGPAAEEGGDIGYVATDELSPFIEEATRGLARDEISRLVKTPQGFYILKVTDVKRERILSGDAGNREAARRMLYQQEMTKRFEEWARELESKAFIQISL